MGAQAMPTSSDPRLSRLLGFLRVDPGNLSLLSDAASAAFDQGELDIALELLDRYEALSPLPPALLNLRALAALSQKRFADAAAIFETLPSAPVVRFNLAWCRAMMEDYEGALALLDDETVAASPHAASLKIEMMHHLDQLEDALACGLGLAELYPDNAALMGALANVAMDSEDLELTRFYAERAGDRPEGQAALGMLMLNDEKVADALGHFDRALSARPDDGRALLGKGLGLLVSGDASATGFIDKGAEVFGDHLGSWIAAGWAYFAKGDYQTSRARFETALALDDTFSESHGGLAVLDVIEGDLQSARRRTEVALRLDRECASAALAQSLLLMGEGDNAGAERIRELVTSAPIGPGGKTIAQAMAGMGLIRR